MKKNIIILMMSFCFMATYNVGDKMSTGHQNQEFGLCYGASADGTVKFSDFNGNTNGGDYHVMVVDMSATWCGPCQSLIPLFDELQQEYINNQYVKFFVALSDSASHPIPQTVSVGYKMVSPDSSAITAFFISLSNF